MYSTQMAKQYDQLPLSSVVCVKACPRGDNESVFDFEVHFSKHKGSPWTLRAYTQVNHHAVKVFVLLIE